MSRYTKEQIDELEKEAAELIDYKVGDWVETCNLLPGIVQGIQCGYNKEKDVFEDTVTVFYPHMAFKYAGCYNGGSHCSVFHCCVHKIDYDYAIMLMALGEERLKNLFDKLCNEMTEDKPMPWQYEVEKYYKENFKK